MGRRDKVIVHSTQLVPLEKRKVNAIISAMEEYPGINMVRVAVVDLSTPLYMWLSSGVVPFTVAFNSLEGQNVLQVTLPRKRLSDERDYSKGIAEEMVALIYQKDMNRLKDKGTIKESDV